MPRSSMARLADRTALVTGGSRGIGRAVAVRFAAEGAAVALNHLRDEAEARTALAECRAASAGYGFGAVPHRVVEADVGSAAAAAAMVADAAAAFGRLDILVNNAGIQAATPGDGDDAATLEAILQVNLAGAAHCARAAIRHFLSRPGGGVILNTSSAHEIIPKPGFLAYSMSKGGLANLTRTLALEFAGRGIRVNAVAPGGGPDEPQRRLAQRSRRPRQGREPHPDGPLPRPRRKSPRPSPSSPPTKPPTSPGRPSTSTAA